MGTQGDFTITGYSSDSAMKDFVDGSSSITEGEMFAEGTADNTCVISSELASYTDLAVGDTITLSNPNQEDETYTLTIAGIYETESHKRFGFQHDAWILWHGAAQLQSDLCQLSDIRSNPDTV